MKRPLTVLFGTVIVWTCVASSVSGMRAHSRQVSALFQLSQGLTFVVNQSDRNLAEHLLSTFNSTSGAESVALCNRQELIISFPVYGPGCVPNTTGIRYALARQIQGHPDYRVTAVFSPWGVVLESLPSALVAASLLFICFLCFREITKKFSRDLLSPVTENLRLHQSNFAIEGVHTPIQEFHELYHAISDRIGEINRLAHENAQQSKNAAIAFMLQTVAHDVRKPFSRLKIGLTTLAKTSSGTAFEMSHRVNRLGRSVESEIENVESMLQDVMDFGADSILDKQAIVIQNIAEEALRDLSLAIQNKNIAIIRNFKKDCIVGGSPRKLRRVLDNLLENAIQAMPDHATLSLTTDIFERETGDFCLLTIHNSGSVIPELVQERLFEPFVTSGKANGTGLGLSIVARIIEQHGGTITCTSTLESGTSFSILLPATKDMVLVKADKSAPSELNPLTGETPSPNSAPLRIALVEDDVWIQEAWEMTAGLAVTCFSSPEAFRTHTVKHGHDFSSWDLIVTDYYFDDPKSGDQLDETGGAVAAFVQKHSLIPVVLSSNASAATLARNSIFSAIVPKGPLSQVAARNLTTSGAMFNNPS